MANAGGALLERFYNVFIDATKEEISKAGSTTACTETPHLTVFSAQDKHRASRGTSLKQKPVVMQGLVQRDQKKDTKSGSIPQAPKLPHTLRRSSHASRTRIKLNRVFLLRRQSQANSFGCGSLDRQQDQWESGSYIHARR